MIALHRINGSKIVINAEHIKSIESNPDTKVILMNEQYYIFKESPEEIIQKVIDYKKSIFFNIKISN